MKSASSHEPVRVLLADDDGLLHARLGARLGERIAGITVVGANDVPSAVEALLVRHPAVVVTDLRLRGHVHGGLRVALEAISLGVDVIAVGGPVSAVLLARLRELGVSWIETAGGDEALIGALERLIRQPAVVLPHDPKQDGGQLGVARA